MVYAGTNFTGFTTRTTNGTLNIVLDPYVAINTTSQQVYLTLPSAAGIAGYGFHVRRSAGTNATSLVAASGQLVNGAATYPLTAIGSKVHIVSDGVGWQVFGT